MLIVMTVRFAQPPVTVPTRRRELTRVPLCPEGVPAVDLTAKPPPGRYVDVPMSPGRTRLFVRETAGPRGATAGTAVYLHGLAGSSTNWTDLARVMACRVRGLAIDLPGFGRSEPPGWFDFSRAAQARVVTRFVEDLGTNPVHLIGNSYGAAVAIEVAARRPDLVTTVTLISPAVPDLRPDLRRVSDRRIVLARLPLVGQRARRELAGVSARERCERLMRLCFADPGSVPPHRVAEAVDEIRERAGLPWAGPSLTRTTGELLRSWVDPRADSLWTLLEAVMAPGLVVWGSEDRLVSVRKAPRTARTLQRGRLLVLPRTGHVAQMERPHVVARAMVAMFDEVRAGLW
jgi:pimeloyl-ACP methyl ester carboxylesterase